MISKSLPWGCIALNGRKEEHPPLWVSDAVQETWTRGKQKSSRLGPIYPAGRTKVWASASHGPHPPHACMRVHTHTALRFPTLNRKNRAGHCGSSKVQSRPYSGALAMPLACLQGGWLGWGIPRTKGRARLRTGLWRTFPDRGKSANCEFIVSQLEMLAFF